MNSRMKVTSIEAIAREAFETGMEVLELIELMERQNTGRINGNISDSGAARAAITIRNSLMARLVILVAGAFSNTRPGDRHLRMGFKAMADPTLRSQLRMNAQAFADAESMWRVLQADPRLAVIKHFRDKQTAHSADPKMRPPTWGETFAFAKEVAAVMENFAIGVGVTTEKFSATEDWRIESSQNFWVPWESLRR